MSLCSLSPYMCGVYIYVYILLCVYTQNCGHVYVYVYVYLCIHEMMPIGTPGFVCICRNKSLCLGL